MYSTQSNKTPSYVNVGALTITYVTPMQFQYAPGQTVVYTMCTPPATYPYTEKDSGSEYFGSDDEDFGSDDEYFCNEIDRALEVEIRRKEIDYISGKPKENTPCRHEARKYDDASKGRKGCVNQNCPYLHDNITELAKNGNYRYPYGLTPTELDERRKKFDEINSDPKKLQEYYEKVLKKITEKAPISTQSEKKRVAISYNYFSEHQAPVPQLSSKTSGEISEKSSKKKRRQRRNKRSKGPKNSE